MSQNQGPFLLVGLLLSCLNTINKRAFWIRHSLLPGKRLFQSASVPGRFDLELQTKPSNRASVPHDFSHQRLRFHSGSSLAGCRMPRRERVKGRLLRDISLRISAKTGQIPTDRKGKQKGAKLGCVRAPKQEPLFWGLLLKGPGPCQVP